MESANPDLREQLCEAVDAAFESEQVPWLQRLVDQPSHSSARADVEAAAAIIDEQAIACGLRRSLYPDPNEVYADHRIYSTPATGDDCQAIALVGHCDTVYPRSQGFLEFRREHGDSSGSADRIRGPGVLDMKSGLSVILFGLRAVQRAAPEFFQELQLRFICNTDEETGSPSSCKLFEAIAGRTPFAMVFEGGRAEDRIITTRKGTGSFTLTALGNESHAGNDHAAGVNAIHALALAIPAVEALTDYDQGTTVNVGIVQGGTAKNTVPGKAECLIDVRISTLEQMRVVESGLRDIASWSFDRSPDAEHPVRKAELVLSGGIRRAPMETTPASTQLRLEYERFAEKLNLGIGQAPLQGGGSDANNLASAGVPTIDGLGPWGENMHSIKEWSCLDSLRKRTGTLACFLAGHQFEG